ncbi:trypsin-like peptidase domain-containing protein [Streptomyces sp. NPDC057696]|uniref:nSTAND1 domain-containing NTPase n=1 Tax=Streptomyces sp. NPDC057696 TaxID=3346218 RepID=UPI00367A86DB
MLQASQVRVLSAEGKVLGAGFLVAADVVCTCAHVVARALGAPDGTLEAPVDAVSLDFPLLEGGPRVRAAVVSWRHGGQDVALLRLEEAVEGGLPAPLVDGTDVWGHPFRTLGYPVGADRGIWASGTLRAEQGSGWVQMEAQQAGPRIARGFSGSPVWDDAQGGVVGMTVAEQRGERTAYLLPSADLINEETVRPFCPFQGLKPFSQGTKEFFHGRDSDIARVHAAVTRRRVTLVAGPSGCGKSSLIAAGVAPRLRAEGIGVTELRPVPGVRASAVLARGLIGLLEPELGEVDRLTKAEELAGLLETRADVPAELRSRVLARGQGVGHVLFIDQFEEYAGAEPAAARRLLGLIAALAGSDGGAELRVMATARPDSLAPLVSVDTTDLLSDAVEFLAPLGAAGLEQAVTAPVDAVPGLWFEPGLPELIVADAGDEPGRMTLVQFALTELWGRRSRSMLTHAAYNKLGGVAGALVKYANDTLDRLPRSQQDAAQRLFVQLARPDGDAFLRRPTRLLDMAPELVDLARNLVSSKLIVLSRSPGSEEEIVDLAHEALTRLWPRLHTWLADSRDFRAWQEQVRADLQRWHAQMRESARLLSGTDLDEAERRLMAHPADISAGEREYIQLSRRHSRRGSRLKRAVEGALVVLTVLAVVLAISTWQSLRKTEETLRIQAAGLLAQAAEDTPGSNPATALQLALAAWNTRQTPKTRDALMHQYAREQYLVSARPSVWQGQVKGMDAAPDGRTLVVVSKPSGGERWTFTVITGALEGKIHTRELSGVPSQERFASAISPDGRLYAVVSPDDVRLWRLNGPKNPIVLNRGKRAIAKEIGATLDFSSDGRRLLLTMDDHSIPCSNGERQCVPPFAEAWEVPSGDRIPVADALVAGYRVDGAAFTTDSDTVVVTRWSTGEGRSEIKDLATGRTLYQTGTRPRAMLSPSAQVTAGGEVALTEVGDQSYAQKLGHEPGPRIPVPAMGGKTDVTGNYAVNRSTDLEEGGYADAVLTDTRTGQAYHTRLPVSDAPSRYDEVAAVPRKDGGLTVFVPIGTTLMAVRAEKSGNKEFRANDDQGAKYALAPDGRFIAKVTEKTLEVMDASRTHVDSVRIPAEKKFDTGMVTWTADSRWVVVWRRNGSLDRAYAAQDLSTSVPLHGAVRAGKEVDSVVGLQGSEIAVLAEDGRLARLDAADGTVLTKPFLTHPGTNSNGPIGDMFTFGQLMPRPGHPGQIAVMTRTGIGHGEILLWDVRALRQVTKLTGPAISVPDAQDSIGSALIFSPDGSRLAVQNSDGQIRLWDVDRTKKLPDEAPSPSLSQLIGFGPDDSLILFLSDKGLIQIHHLSDKSTVTWAVTDGIDKEITDTTAKITQNHRLLIDNGTQRRSFELRPEAQFHNLCAAARRDYTKAENKLLPEGTPPDPPCS